MTVKVRIGSMIDVAIAVANAGNTDLILSFVGVGDRAAKGPDVSVRGVADWRDETSDVDASEGDSEL